VDRNVLMRYSTSETHFTEHDSTSIMQYPVSKELTTGGFEIGWNCDLSETDKRFIKAMYP
jgi:serralysin